MNELPAAQRRGRSCPLEPRYRPVLPAARTTFTVDVAGARVTFLVRCSGAKVGVIALCTPRHAHLVQNALARVAAGMRARGASVDAAVREVCTV